jgi:adenylate cyclase
MADDHTQRRLAAILAADVVGYSRMMGADEAGTLASLKRHREAIFDPAISEHRGRIVKLIGDGTLAEFGSVVDAVNCAIAIQRACKAGADTSTITLRIGVNLGDVIIEGDDIYGDGVNVAARLEPLAEPGGICIASIVHESIGNRVDAVFKDGGYVSVKNIDRPVRVWKWDPGVEAVTARPAATAPGKPPAARAAEQPSIAVLPFDNMSGDPEQEYFSDGMAEDIITDLSKIGGLLVIARNSSFAYKGKSTDIRTVGRELGARAVLEGSIRRAGSRVRINAQLIDATSGGHLWADRYDRDLTDIFAVQDEVTRHIVDALKVKLNPGEASRISGGPTANLEAHDLFMKARALLQGQKKDREMFDLVTTWLNRAIELDPDYSDAYAGLGMVHNLDFLNRWTGATDALEMGARLAAKAVAKDPNAPYGRVVSAITSLWQGNLEKSRRESEAALALNPNYDSALAVRGIVEIFDGSPIAGIPYLERAMHLDPIFAQQYIHYVGSAYLVAARYEAAAAAFRERIRLSPKTDISRSLLASALGHLGETDEAARVWAELQAINPRYSLDEHLARLPFRNPADRELIRSGLQKAGLAS